MIMLEPQSATPQGRPQNVSSIVAVQQGSHHLCSNWKVPLRVGYGYEVALPPAQHIAGAAAMAFPCIPCGQEIF